MPFPVTINGNTYAEADFSPYGYVTNFPAIINDIATVANAIAAAAAGIVIGSLVVTGASATVVTAGRLGATTPAFQVDSATASQITGVKIKGYAASGGADITAIGETNVALRISSAGSGGLVLDGGATGTIVLGGTSSGAITLTRATTISAALTYGAVTLSNAVTGTGNMVLSAGPTLTGTLTAATIAASGVLSTTDATASTSTTTGALKVSGGAGIVKELFAGLDITVSTLGAAYDSYVNVYAGGGAARKCGIKFHTFTTSYGFKMYYSDVTGEFLLWRHDNDATGAAVMTVSRVSGGTQFGAPTGGDKGVGTINCKAVYDDNTLLTDYVFDKYLKIAKPESYSLRVRELFDTLDPQMFVIDAYSAYWRKHRRLYGMPDGNDCIDGIIKEISIGGLCQRLTQTVELQAIHMGELHTRLAALESRALH